MECWVWLQQALGQGSSKVEGLLNHFGDIEAVFSAGVSDFATVPSLTSREIACLCDKSLDKSVRFIENCLKNNYKIITQQDSAFPQRLKSIYAPPCVLYIQGEPGPVDDLVLIAIVGTRQITEYGVEASAKLSAGLASHGAVVISGLALGVDTEAHKGALKGGGRTIAVIGCGLDYDYPVSNRELKRLIASNGAIISEYPPGTPPMSHHFPVRNRIIAGLSLGTVVIEAGSRSGALITAGLAAEAGRDVFAVPGSIFSPSSEGANRLLRDGAKPVCSVVDILEEYIEHYPQSISIGLPEEHEENGKPEDHFGDASPSKVKSAPQQTQLGFTNEPKPAPKNLTAAQTAVFNLLRGSPIHVDEIALRANLEPRVVSGILTTLEIMGYIRSFPGRRFAAL